MLALSQARPAAGRRLSALSAAAALLLALWAPPAAGAPGENPSPSRGIFWKVTQGGATVYLLGSVHVADESVYPLAPEIEAAWKASGVLVEEADLGPSTRVKLSALMLKLGAYSDGTTVEDHLSPATVEKVKTWAGDHGLPWGNLRSLRPWLLAATLTVNAMQRQGLSGDDGIDVHFLERAEAEGKSVRYLESAEAQVRLLADLPDQIQELMLDETILEIGTIGESARAILSAWREGDAEGLEEALFEEFADPKYEPLFRKVFTDRNDSMTEAIRKLLEEKGTFFVVVGSGHLLGGTGIVRQLKGSGVKVERLPAPARALPRAS